MIAAPIPKNEKSRLMALAGYQILRTKIEREFDDITEEAAHVCETEISAVSLIGTNFQWFKSIQGIELAETPRDVSFCGHTILQDTVFVVEDTEDDPRFEDNPFVAEAPNVRFYAGAPITLEGGHNIGTLCVIDLKPRTFSKEDCEKLQELAEMVKLEMLVHPTDNK